MFRDDDAGRYVCHYTTTETFLAHILPTMKLRLSSFSRVNDPRESRAWYCSLTVPDEVADREWNITQLSASFTAYMKETAKLLCVTRDDPNFDPNREAYLYGRCYAHPSMWDRYAGNHSGVCLMFDIEDLGAAVARASEGRGDVYYQAVSYADMPPVEHPAYALDASDLFRRGEAEVFRDHQIKHHGALYFWKSRDWAAEFEYRWVVLDSESSDIFVNIEECLAGVIFGDAFTAHTIPMVAQMLADRDVTLAQMRYRNGHPTVLPVIGT